MYKCQSSCLLTSKPMSLVPDVCEAEFQTACQNVPVIHITCNKMGCMPVAESSTVSTMVN